MCILSYLPPETPVDEDGLFNGGINNPDGHGWAIVAGEFIILGKSLCLAEAVEEFSEARRTHPDGPALFHSRWATHGSVRVGNIHPFLVGGSHRTVVAHNGILPEVAHPVAGDDRSDSRKFADEILPRRFRRLDRRNVQRALSQWCGSFNKLVILTTDSRYRQSSYVINEHAGQWDCRTGIWHSNGDYLGYPKGPASLAGAATSASDGYRLVERCLLCDYPGIDPNGYCYECRSCQDCMEHLRDCVCWSGNWSELEHSAAAWR